MKKRFNVYLIAYTILIWSAKCSIECEIKNCETCSSEAACQKCERGFVKETSFSSTGLKYDICRLTKNSNWMLFTILGILSILLLFTIAFIFLKLKEKIDNNKRPKQLTYPENHKNSIPQSEPRYLENKNMETSPSDQSRYLETMMSTARNLNNPTMVSEEMPTSTISPFEPIKSNIHGQNFKRKKVIKIDGRFVQPHQGPPIVIRGVNAQPRVNQTQVIRNFHVSQNMPLKPQSVSQVWHRAPESKVYKVEESLNQELNKESKESFINTSKSGFLQSFGNPNQHMRVIHEPRMVEALPERLEKRVTSGKEELPRLQNIQMRVPFKDIATEQNQSHVTRHQGFKQGGVEHGRGSLKRKEEIYDKNVRNLKKLKKVSLPPLKTTKIMTPSAVTSVRESNKSNSKISEFLTNFSHRERQYNQN